MFEFLLTPPQIAFGIINYSCAVNAAWMGAWCPPLQHTPKYLDRENKVINLGYSRRYRVNVWHPERAHVVALRTKAPS